MYTCSVAKSYPTLWDPMDCSLPVSSVHSILHARILEWVAISSSRRSSRQGIKLLISCVPALAGRFFATKLPVNTLGCLKNRKLFFTVLDTRKSKVKVPADLVPSESSLPVLQTANFFFFGYTFMWREIISFTLPLLKAPILFMWVLPSWLNYLLIALPHLGIWTTVYEFCRDTKSSSQHLCSSSVQFIRSVMSNSLRPH